MADLNRPRIKSENEVWDVGTLSWVAMTQPSTGPSGTSDVQYVEDVASPSDPTGTALALRRRDTLSSEVSTDGDIVIANATSKGELYVKHVDPLPTGTNQIGSVKQGDPNADPTKAWFISQNGKSAFPSVGLARAFLSAPGDFVTGTTDNQVGGCFTVEIFNNLHSGVVVNMTMRTDSSRDVAYEGLRLDTMEFGSSTGVMEDNSAQFWIFPIPNASQPGNPTSIRLECSAITLGTVIAQVGISAIPYPFPNRSIYTEDRVAPDDPSVTMMGARRRDAIGTEVSDIGDVVALNSTAKGELYVKHKDHIIVDQGSGSGTGWFTKSFGPVGAQALNDDMSLDVVGDERSMGGIDSRGSNFYLEIAGTYTGAAVEFYLDIGVNRDNVFGIRLDTGVAESTSTLVDNGVRRWKFFCPGVTDTIGLALVIKLTAITSGALTLNAVVTSQAYDFTAASPTTQTNNLQFDYAGGSNLIYVGSAPPGVATSFAGWQIRKFTYDGSSNITSILYANGLTTYNLVWDDRATYTYI